MNYFIHQTGLELNMPRGGARPNTGGARPGAGRPRTRATMSVELTEQATKQLAYFVDNLNLSPSNTQAIISRILINALTEDYDKWANLFGNQLYQSE